MSKIVEIKSNQEKNDIFMFLRSSHFRQIFFDSTKESIRKKSEILLLYITHYL